MPIYGVAKTVADCFKHRRHVGEDVAIEALRDALRQRKTTPSELMAVRRHRPGRQPDGALHQGHAMKDKVLKDPAASIRQRLHNHARQHGDDFNRMLVRYAIERFLFRLSETKAAERYVLKGAMLFVTWPQHALRPTGDLDLLGEGDPDPAALTELFTRICKVEVPDDGIVFDPATSRSSPPAKPRSTRAPGSTSRPSRTRSYPPSWSTSDSATTSTQPPERKHLPEPTPRPARRPTS